MNTLHALLLAFEKISIELDPDNADIEKLNNTCLIVEIVPDF
jgi:hypothetical protein